MPIRTKMLEYGDFVHSPKLSPDAAFVAYLETTDRLLTEWRQAAAQSSEFPFDAELAARRQATENALLDYVTPFKQPYTIRSVEQDPRFLSAAQFFAQYHPIREPFAILHCDLDMPLHTVLAFPKYEELARVNAALEEETPLRWWRDGSGNRPCYLFGRSVWELKASEAAGSDKGVHLLFLEASERTQQRLNRLNCPQTAMADCVPEKLRVAAWRRNGGKCAKCGRHDQLDFEYVVPPSRGGSTTLDNVQVICARCHEKAAGSLSPSAR